MIALTSREKEAVIYLAEYEVVKVAADKRCVSEHTEKNQIKSAMLKLGVTTQIGLIKEFFHMLYNVEFSLRDARQALAVVFLAIFLTTINDFDQVARRTRIVRSRRNETEYVIEL